MLNHLSLLIAPNFEIQSLFKNLKKNWTESPLYQELFQGTKKKKRREEDMHATKTFKALQKQFEKNPKNPCFSNMRCNGGSLHHGCLLPKTTMAEFIKKNYHLPRFIPHEKEKER